MRSSVRGQLDEYTKNNENQLKYKLLLLYFLPDDRTTIQGSSVYACSVSVCLRLMYRLYAYSQITAIRKGFLPGVPLFVANCSKQTQPVLCYFALVV